jgi:hypothetical protein
MSIGTATAAACAAVAGLAGVLAPGDDGPAASTRRDARALVRAPGFDRAIDELESAEEWTDYEGRLAVEEHRREVKLRLERDVRAGGDELVDAAVDLVVDGDDEDRRRAELLLAQRPHLPAAAYARLEGAARFDAWALALLHRRSSEDFLVDEVESTHCGWCVSGSDPVASVAADLRDRLAFDGHRLAQCTEEFQEDYRREALPKLERLAENITLDESFATDLDGDEDPEVVVAAEAWKDSHYLEGLAFVALLDREGKDAPWRVVAFEHVEQGEHFEGFVVRDFDRDGTPEVAVRSRMQNWPIGYARMVRFGAQAPFPRLESVDPCVKVLLVDRTLDEPTRFVTSGCHVRDADGPSTLLSGMVAVQRECFTWKGDVFVPAETIFVPYR